jgi:hypothetical protein
MNKREGCKYETEDKEEYFAFVLSPTMAQALAIPTPTCQPRLLRPIKIQKYSARVLEFETCFWLVEL